MTPDDEEDNFYDGFNLFISKEGLKVQGIVKSIIQEI